MRREPVCAGKWRGKEIVYLPAGQHKNITTRRTSNANRFKIFHRVDLPDYLIFAQDDRAEKCTRMPEARAELL